MRRCAFPLFYNHYIEFPDARASLYRSTMYRRRDLVREIGSTRLPARKIARPQLTRATARQRREKSTKKRTASTQQHRASTAAALAGATAQIVEVTPTRCRWISTLRLSPDSPPGDKMFFSVSVPASCQTSQLRLTSTLVEISKWRGGSKSRG